MKLFRHRQIADPSNLRTSTKEKIEVRLKSFIDLSTAGVAATSLTFSMNKSHVKFICELLPKHWLVGWSITRVNESSRKAMDESPMGHLSRFHLIFSHNLLFLRI
jgi:hypothetical protein